MKLSRACGCSCRPITLVSFEATCQITILLGGEYAVCQLFPIMRVHRYVVVLLKATMLLIECIKLILQMPQFFDWLTSFCQDWQDNLQLGTGNTEQTSPTALWSITCTVSQCNFPVLITVTGKNHGSIAPETQGFARNDTDLI